MSAEVEIFVRLGAFLSVLLLMAIGEIPASRRPLTARKALLGLRTIGVASRHSENAKGESDEVRYFTSSPLLSVKRFVAWVGIGE